MKEEKGGGVGEGKRVEERDSGVAEKRWVRRSKTAIWWMREWMWGTSEGIARRMRMKSGAGGWVGVTVGVGVGSGGGAAAAAISDR